MSEETNFEQEEACTHDCSSCESDCAQRQNTPQSFLEDPHPMSNVKKVVGVVSGKGGVGKSLVTGLLAVLLNRLGYHTAILDADITGPSIPKMFGIHEKAEGNEFGILPARTKTGIDVMSLNLLLENETDPVVWRGPIIAGTVKQFWTDVVWKDVDFLLVDMPPGTGDVPLTVFQSLPVDGIVVVTSPQELVSLIVEKAVNMARLMNIPILGVVENMSYLSCPDCGKKIYPFGESRLETVAKEQNIALLGRIPIDPEIALNCDRGLAELIHADYLKEAAEAVESLLTKKA